MINGIFSAIIAVFIAIFIFDKKETAPKFLLFKSMFTKENFMDTLKEFKTYRAWFVVLIVFLLGLIF